MPGTMKLGFVVLNWNGRVHLERGLPSLMHDLRPNDFCIVVDNASEDGSADWVRRTHPDAEVLELESNRRFAGGNNAGAARAIERGADVVVLLNNDTLVDEGVAATLADAFGQDERVDVVGLRIVHAADPGMIWYGGGTLDLRWGLATHRALRKRASAGLDPEGETAWVTGCCLAVRSRLWSELGGLDEDYYIYAEDVDFSVRAAARGVKIHYSPRASIRHDVSATVGGSRSPFKAYHKVRSRWQLFARHGEGVLWPLGVLAMDLVEILRALSSGSPAAAKAVVEAWYDGGPGQRSDVRYPTENLGR